MAVKSAKNLIWIDLEMTGLQVEENRIIEIATIITDSQLNIVAEGPVLAVHQLHQHLNAMDDWNTYQHNRSGLITRVEKSSINELQAEQQTLTFLQQYVPAGKSPMCGNSVCQDRRFLHAYMPKLAAYFHYRNLDVSTLKELCRRWMPDIAKRYVKQPQHLALQDIYDSIDELKFYRQYFIKKN